MPLKNPVVFSILVVAVLLGAAFITYLYGLPSDSAINCRNGVKSFGCYSSFGTFITLVAVGVVVAIGAIWSKFGRH